MSKEHEALKEVAHKLLKNIGFQDKEIQEEFWVQVTNGLKGFRVDVVGITETRKVAVECGNTPGEKIAALKMFFDDVIVLPYFTINQDRETDLKIIREQRTKIETLEKELIKLQSQNKTEEQKFYLVRDLIQDSIEIGHRWLNRGVFYADKNNMRLQELITIMINNLQELNKTTDKWYP